MRLRDHIMVIDRRQRASRVEPEVGISLTGPLLVTHFLQVIPKSQGNLLQQSHWLGTSIECVNQQGTFHLQTLTNNIFRASVSYFSPDIPSLLHTQLGFCSFHSVCVFPVHSTHSVLSRLLGGEFMKSDYYTAHLAFCILLLLYNTPPQSVDMSLTVPITVIFNDFVIFYPADEPWLPSAIIAVL